MSHIPVSAPSEKAPQHEREQAPPIFHLSFSGIKSDCNTAKHRLLKMEHIEGVSEINSHTEAPYLHRKHNDPPRHPLEPQNDPVWPEQTPSSTLPDNFLETLTGEQSADPSPIVEELTVQNYRIPSTSSSGGESLNRRAPWLNFSLLGAATRRDTLREELSLPMTTRDPAGGFTRIGTNPIDITSNRNGVSSSAPTTLPAGIRTRMIQASGFGQLMIKSSLKGKGIAHQHQEGQHAQNPLAIAIRNQNSNSMMERNNTEGKSLLGNNKSLLGNSGGAIEGSDGKCDGITLREWLRVRHGKFNKAERLYVLRQIVELVDITHSQGLALRSLSPSHLQMLLVDQIRYVGSLVHAGQFEPMPRSAGGEEQNLKRKRCSEQETNARTSLKQLKYFEDTQRGDVREETNASIFNTRSESDQWRALKLGESRQASGRLKSPVESCFGGLPATESFAATEILKLEERWYASPEEINEGICSLSSNIYNLGILVFELFCYFETWEAHFAAMSDLRHRILPPSFLSESPKEASFCLWLLHPEPSSRPKSRDILTCDLVCEGRKNLSSLDHSSVSIEEEDAEADLLLHFLFTLKEQKEKHAAKLTADLGCLQADTEEIEKRQLSRTRLPSSSKDLCFQRAQIPVEATPRLPMSNTNDNRLMRNINQLEDAYFSMRSKLGLPETNDVARPDRDVLMIRDRCSQAPNHVNSSKEPTDRLGAFFDGLCKYARYTRFEVCGSLKNTEFLNSANVICSLSFDRDEEYFAAAGVSKKIKIFEYSSLLDDNVDIHYPLIELSSKSKLSCVCWNGYIKNFLASTDYDGVVQLWDASTGQGFTQYREHQKRAWSVDFSPTDPMKLASGSDDFSVKLWNINEKNCINSIRNSANICCVQFSSHSSHFLACGSADYRIYCYDLRNTRNPWCTLSGHGKAVSYVKFIDSATIVSASTDNTLKLWDLNKTVTGGFSTGACSSTFNGHTNEKNFVGLSVSDGYIACGSETNEVYAYYKTFPMSVTSHKFGSIDPITGQETSDDNGQFVSSVCWRTKSNVVVTANSTGSIKLLQLV